MYIYIVREEDSHFAIEKDSVSFIPHVGLNCMTR